MKVAADTNILVYAEGVDSIERRIVARAVLNAFPAADIVLPVQVLAELYAVLVRKGRRSREEAAQNLLVWWNAHPHESTSGNRLLAASMLATHYKLQIFDAIILATAADAGCQLLLSEDMQEGFSWLGCTIVNPFAAVRHPSLRIALGE